MQEGPGSVLVETKLLHASTKNPHATTLRFSSWDLIVDQLQFSKLIFKTKENKTVRGKALLCGDFTPFDDSFSESQSYSVRKQKSPEVNCLN